MKVIQSQNNNLNNISFSKITIPDEKTCNKILRRLNENQLSKLRNSLISQQNNPVNAVIIKNKFGLKAKLYCQYRLKNFIETYNQIPFLESNESFLKRIIEKCNEYKKQLEEF